MRAIVLRNRYALGDTICMSAVVRDLHRAHPGRFRVSFAGHYMSYWRHDPGVAPIDPAANAPVLDVAYSDGIRESTAGRYRYHFLTWFHRWLGERLGVAIPVTEPRGVIHLGPDRRLAPPGRYWVVVAGGKLDVTTKWWPPERYQAAVDALAAQGVRCVQAGADFHTHVHPRLRNCESFVGRTDDIADLFSLIRHSEGVICGITGAMHAAAAFGKPCVVVAGGREEWWWEAYTNHGQWPDGCAPVAVPHRFLHTLGTLDCCRKVGCWKMRTVPIEPADTTTLSRREKLCRRPVRDPLGARPECMDQILPDHVVEAAMSYYENGTLPPVGEPSKKYSVPTPSSPPEPAPNAPAEVTVGSEPAAFAVLDHPIIGGKYTLFVLCYGPHPELARSCLESIQNSVPASRLDIRVALNQACDETTHYIRGLLESGVVTKVYPDAGARRKYPAMRDSFWDPEHPIRTPYVIWFDDDAQAIDKNWLPKLTETIIANHPHGSRLYGAKFTHDLAMYARNGHRPDLWFREAPWWRGEHLYVRNRPATASNGSVIPFVSGWFWALATETIRKADIPDRRLNHNGGDCTIGAQVHQVGGRIKEFNTGKSYVWTPTREKGGRRGYSEAFPWAAPASQPG
jgi:ADP-heptose:LPS heptosyltransferase